jgi:plastocyanin
MKVVIIGVVVALSGLALADGKIIGSVEAKPSKYLKDTIVFVKSVPSTKLAAKTVEIDQKGMEFVPHAVLLAVGDTVRFQNHDKVDHNVMSPDGGYDLGTWGGGQEKDHAFKTEGVFAQTCKLHPEMIAYVFVGQNRFAAIVDDKGGFSIDGVPPGTYELAIWNPKLKAVSQRITVKDGAVSARFALAR